MPTFDPAANRSYCRKHYEKVRADPAKWQARIESQRLRRRAASIEETDSAKFGSHCLESLSEDEREAFEERAAIMEFDGGLTRNEAEQAALRDVLSCRG
jgi:hypothetical protein